MSKMPDGTTRLPIAERSALPEPAHVVGAIGLLSWIAALTLTDFAHDALGIGGIGGIGGTDAPASPGAFALYEIASGYVLGFMAAVAVAMLGGLLRADAPEVSAVANPWLRQLVALALFMVAVACVAGAAVHNAEGITLLYDIAFATGLLAVFAGVVPLHRHLASPRDG